jgi:hypothetical protein
MNYPRYETWKPAQGTLTAKIVEIGTADAGYGPSTVANVTDENGKGWKVWINAKMLLDQWEKAQPRVGEIVVIRYEGKRTSESTGREYHAYELAVIRDTPGSSGPQRTTARSDKDIAITAIHRAKQRDNEPSYSWVFCEDSDTRQNLPGATISPLYVDKPTTHTGTGIAQARDLQNTLGTASNRTAAGYSTDPSDPFDWGTPEPQHSIVHKDKDINPIMAAVRRKAATGNR